MVLLSGGVWLLDGVGSLIPSPPLRGSIELSSWLVICVMNLDYHGDWGELHKWKEVMSTCNRTYISDDLSDSSRPFAEVNRGSHAWVK